MFDFLIAGAGFAGSVCAERLAKAGMKVLLVDRRPHLAGNAYDHFDAAGVQIHKYGPHIFHTNSDKVYGYLSNFTQWRAYEHRVLASVDGKLLPIPINRTTINSIYDKGMTTEAECADFLASLAEPVEICRNSEDIVVSKVGRHLYEKFIKHYTRKQWGLDPSELDASVLARIPTRTNLDDRYFGDKHQVMPLSGYTKMFENMTNHPNIQVMLGTDYDEIKNKIPHSNVIFTGPVDEFFGFRFGKLPYRSLDFRFETHTADLMLPVGVVNYPNENDYTRVTEFKHLTGQKHSKTTLVYEYPQAEGDPYYPIPRAENAELYARYRTLAEATPGVWFVGRLATYKYYNMDQVVAQALTTVDKILASLVEHEGNSLLRTA
jgi:UDP-galactopyranose mutase